MSTLRKRAGRSAELRRRLMSAHSVLSAPLFCLLPLFTKNPNLDIPCWPSSCAQLVFQDGSVSFRLLHRQHRRTKMDEKGQAETIRPASLVRAPSWRAFPSPHPDQEHAQVAYAPGSSDRDSTKSVPESGQDIEKAAPAPISKVSGDTQEQESSKALRPLQWAAVKLAKWNVETRGIDPVPAEERTHTQYWSVGLLWFSANCNGEHHNRPSVGDGGGLIAA